MKSPEKVIDHIVQWLNDYADNAKMNGFVASETSHEKLGMSRSDSCLWERQVLLHLRPSREYRERHVLTKSVSTDCLT